MNANETLELISKQWCTLSDLMQLTSLGRNSALKIRKEILNDLKNNSLFELDIKETFPNRYISIATLKNNIPNFSTKKFIEIIKDNE